jgi:hypothetical protein
MVKVSVIKRIRTAMMMAVVSLRFFFHGHPLTLLAAMER